MLIALIGPNGTGKTTSAKLLTAALPSAENIKGTNYFLLGLLKKYFKGQKVILLEPAKASWKENIWKIFWVILVWFDYLLFSFYLKIVSRGKTIILDRYFYDLLIVFRQAGILTSCLERLFLFLPRPDYIFLFDLNFIEAKKRKGEEKQLSVENYNEQRRLYRDLAQKLKVEILSVDSGQEQIVSSLLKKINK